MHYYPDNLCIWEDREYCLKSQLKLFQLISRRSKPIVIKTLPKEFKNWSNKKQARHINHIINKVPNKELSIFDIQIFKTAVNYNPNETLRGLIPDKIIFDDLKA